MYKQEFFRQLQKKKKMQIKFSFKDLNFQQEINFFIQGGSFSIWNLNDELYDSEMSNIIRDAVRRSIFSQQWSCQQAKSTHPHRKANASTTSHWLARILVWSLRHHNRQG